MLTEICQYLRNWFEREKYFGKFVISQNAITTSEGVALPILEDQYFRIIGSIFNDGVHKNGDLTDILKDEPEFSGAVWTMAVPPQLAELAEEIDSWTTNNAEVLNSPYQSESFGGYSYSIRSGASGNASDSNAYSGASWQNQFSARLAHWRKI